jgi:hypothetical protein
MMAPEVARVRQDLWDGVSTAPFPSWKDASAWLENTFGAREERTTGENARAHRLFTDWIQDPRKAEIEGITGVQIHVEYRAHLIPYITDGICHVVVPHGSPFVALGTGARSLADATGFDPASIVMHILTDSPLVLPSIRITETRRFGRFGGGRGTVRAEFNSPDVTHTQIENVLKRVREFWGKSSKRRLTPEDERFRAIINQVAHDLNLEGVPEYGKKGFFEAVRDICMDEGLGSYNNSDTGWRGPYMRWRRTRRS